MKLRDCAPLTRSFLLPYFCLGTKAPKNQALIEKREWKAIARLLCAPFKKGARGQYGLDEVRQLESDVAYLPFLEP